MVVEASGGGWGAEARKVWAAIAKAGELLSGEKAAVVAERLLQNMAIVLHRENARAILRRAVGAGTSWDSVSAAAHIASDGASQEAAAET
jgi:hypothetical protein